MWSDWEEKHVMEKENRRDKNYSPCRITGDIEGQSLETAVMESIPEESEASSMF